MTDKHLLDTEIERLLDGERGAEVAPWLAHVEECASCRRAVAQGEALIHGLAALPSIAPPPGFADRVIERTRSIVPWHIAARNAVERALGAIPGAGWLAAGGMSMAGMAMTAVAVWLAPRSDAVVFAGQIGMQSLGLQVVPALRAIAEGVLGAPVVGAIQGAGGIGIVAAVALTLFTGLTTMVGLRASATRRARS